MKKQTKEKRRAITDYAIAVIFILSVTAIIYIVCMLLVEQLDETSYASMTATTENSTSNLMQTGSYLQSIDINLNEIIESNISNIKEEIIVEKVDLEYITKYTNDSSLPKGMLQVLQEGVNGEQEIYTKKIYNGEELIEEKQIGSKITKTYINKIVAVGTGGYSSNYNVKIGDTLYVTSNLLAVRIEAADDASKLISLNKNTEVKVLQIKDEWYQIQYQNYKGWAKAECLTYLKPDNEGEKATSQYTKEQLLNKLKFNMDLRKPSGLSLEQFKEIFKDETKDTNNIFYNNAQYFYYAEKQYGINGVFLAAVAIHESGWGTSSIAIDKNNLFGYGAYDNSPYTNSYEFSDYSEGIDLLARVFVKYYLNSAGTKIYDGVAVGTYYNGTTLSGVNIKYATDKNWANSVYKWMEYLYNKL